MVNADARGYYLTEYEPAAVAALATRTPPLTPAERISLLGDEWRMVRAGRHDIGTYLDLAAAFAGDDTPAVLGDLAGRVGYVASFVADAGERPAFEAWTQARFRPALDALGLTGGVGDSDDTNRRRGTLLQLLDSDPSVQQRARELAEGYLANPATLAPTLVGPVLGVAAAGGDAALYDRYMAKITSAGASPEDYYRFFNALPAFRQPALVARTLAFALSPDVRSQDTPVLLAALLGSPASQQVTWAFVKDQWPALTAKLGVFQGVPYRRRRARLVLRRGQRGRHHRVLQGAPGAGSGAGAAAGHRAHQRVRGGGHTAVAGVRALARNAPLVRRHTRARPRASLPPLTGRSGGTAPVPCRR